MRRAKLNYSSGATNDASIGDQLSNFIVRSIGFEACAIGGAGAGLLMGASDGEHYRTQYVNGVK
ncbi:MAG TPA: hypothetical protein VGM92_04600 [Candidatus Kapabacteria bacterium]